MTVVNFIERKRECIEDEVLAHAQMLLEWYHMLLFWCQGSI
jgi:hypothetical protein